MSLWNRLAAEEMLEAMRWQEFAQSRPVHRPAHLKYVDCPEAINRADCLGRAEFHFGMAKLYRANAKRRAV